MQEFTTPMMRQYKKIKKQYQDCLLFYRMGDFYELFLEDAHIGARILNITLTSRAKGKDGRIPMAGVPYHAVDTYLAKLVKAGYKVAICEQLSPPNKRGIVERDVVRIVTPGTLLDEHALEKKENNYIVSVAFDEKTLAIACADLSTGYFATTEYEADDVIKILTDALSRLHPAECILPDELYNDPELLNVLKTEKGVNIFPFGRWSVYASDSKEFLQKHFGIASLEVFDIAQNDGACKTAAALLGYLKETQKGNVSHIKKIVSLREDEGLILDRSTMINLELFSTIREHDLRGSLLSVLDETITAVGGRLLKQWMKKPLIHKERIEERLDAIEAFLAHPEARDILREQLKQIPDIERLLSRLSVNLGNARDLVNLKLALQSILEIKKLLGAFSPSNLKKLKKASDTPDTFDTPDTLLQLQSAKISLDLQKIINHIDSVIVSEPPIAIKEGGLIKEGVNEAHDKLRKTIGKSKSWIMELERTEREKTGIGSLKVRFNKVFGFYIEISKANLHLVPDTYMRKQTLVNGERFITKELKEQEEIILTAEEKIHELEYTIFTETLAFVLSHTEHIQNAAESIAVLDCLANFSYLAEKHRYTRPKLLYSGEIRIKGGRHPVVEKLLEDKPFVPNDVTLDNVSQSLLLITGPNMAGKSVFIRQTALIVLMTQMGSFIPAQSAHISIVDRIFVRSGASDVITSGLSTFMVEMVETAHILNNATKNSLIVMDEIGRGTSTYDGISIAWAVAEYLVTHIKPSPKVLFATHYHELQALEEKYPNKIKNFHMAATEEKGSPIFLHTILPGGASHSFGVAVARLAGVPQQVIDRAYEMLQTLEYRDVTEKGKEYFDRKNNVILSPAKLDEGSFKILHSVQNDNLVDHLLHKELENLDVANMTPLEALNKLAELKEKFKLLKSQETKKFLEAD